MLHFMSILMELCNFLKGLHGRKNKIIKRKISECSCILYCLDLWEKRKAKARISSAIQELSASINMECMFNKFQISEIAVESQLIKLSGSVLESDKNIFKKAVPSSLEKFMGVF